MVGPTGVHRLEPLSLGGGSDQIVEQQLQELIHANPSCLPIVEIDPMFADPVPLCTELRVSSGLSVDNVMVTESGLPILIECKLWRNPEARREVIGQILDYAKELARWSASDLQREVAKRVGGDGNPILRLLKEHKREVDEIAFNDALTHNLRRGRFLLLIVGDGIREGVEAIAEYLQLHAGLHFSLGLVELPIFLLPDGGKLIAPRVLARTELIQRTVVAVPENHVVVEDANAIAADDEEALNPNSRINFWTDFIKGLRLDDPDQPMPRASRQGYVNVMMPVPAGHCWLTVYRNEARNEVGVYLSFTRESVGEAVVDVVLSDWPAISEELGSAASIETDKNGRRLIQDHLRTGAWAIPAERERALAWLRQRTNDFVNVLRPRVKAALADMSGSI